MALPKVLFLGFDLVAEKLAPAIPSQNESKGFGRGKLTPNNFEISCNNISDFFSIDNPNSILNGTDWLYEEIQVYNEDNILTFDGIVADISRDHQTKKATLKCRDKIFQNRKTPISYTSSQYETAAEAALNIFSQEGFTNFESKTFTDSDSILTSLGIKVKCDFQREDNLSLFQVIEKLGLYAGADVWMHLNNINMLTWTRYTGGVSVNIQEKDLETAPIVTNAEDEMYNDYSIGYEGDQDTPETDGGNNSLGLASRNKYGTQSFPEIKSGDNAQIKLENAAAAVALGELAMERSHFAFQTNPRTLQKTYFNLKWEFRRLVELGTIFKLTFGEEGWDEKVFEVFGTDRDEDNRKLSILAYESET